MLFHSLPFLIFFASFLVLLPLFRGPKRLAFTLFASYVFYAWWYPPYLVVIIGLTVVCHVGAMHASRRPRHLGLMVALLLLPLAVFKYIGFLFENLGRVVGWEQAFAPTWSLPLGISFITFTAIAYVVDAARGTFSARPTPLTTALYIAYFPQLIAGPILRARELVPQLSRIAVQRSMIRYACALFALGVVKKVVFADSIAPYVDKVYGATEPIQRGDALLAAYGFTVQIYCDFSGYSDMAIALAALLGVRLPRNFERPYLAASVREFWQRWHMTLSRWLRDYLYVPLGGSRKGTARTMVAVMVTMLLGGLWHGAAWTFIVWGGLHGAAICAQRWWSGTGWRLPVWLAWLLAVHFVVFTWVLFRAPDLAAVERIGLGLTRSQDWSDFIAASVWPLLLIATFVLLHPFDSVTRVRWIARVVPATVLYPVVLITLTVCVALSVDNPNAFIYFDF